MLATPAFLAVVGILVVILGLGGFFYHKISVQATADRIAMANAEKKLQEEAKARHDAELKAAQEAKDLEIAKAEIAQKNAAAEAIAKKAEEEAKQRED